MTDTTPSVTMGKAKAKAATPETYATASGAGGSSRALTEGTRSSGRAAHEQDSESHATNSSQFHSLGSAASKSWASQESDLDKLAEGDPGDDAGSSSSNDDDNPPLSPSPPPPTPTFGPSSTQNLSDWTNRKTATARLAPNQTTSTSIVLAIEPMKFPINLNNFCDTNRMRRFRDETRDLLDRHPDVLAIQSGKFFFPHDLGKVLAVQVDSADPLDWLKFFDTQLKASGRDGGEFKLDFLKSKTQKFMDIHDPTGKDSHVMFIMSMRTVLARLLADDLVGPALAKQISDSDYGPMLSTVQGVQFSAMPLGVQDTWEMEHGKNKDSKRQIHPVRFIDCLDSKGKALWPSKAAWEAWFPKSHRSAWGPPDGDRRRLRHPERPLALRVDAPTRTSPGIINAKVSPNTRTNLARNEPNPNIARVPTRWSASAIKSIATHATLRINATPTAAPTRTTAWATVNLVDLLSPPAGARTIRTEPAATNFLRSNQEDSDKNMKCNICALAGHRAANCPNKGSGATLSAPSSPADSPRSRAGPYPRWSTSATWPCSRWTTALNSR
jgi:hypothetical protein